MSRPVLAFLTDFGLADHYVASMKAVALSICPDAVLVDITHEIAPHDIAAGAYELAVCYADFPAGTVFVGVVDPGVGSGRRAIAARTADYRFVGPDNGLFSHVLADRPPEIAVAIEAPAYARPVISRTFEGRDRFTPAAAWLARGLAIEALGPSVSDLVRLPTGEPIVRDDGLEGTVIHIDRFGNAVTNIRKVQFDRMFPRPPSRVTADGRTVAGVVGTYEECAPGAVCALFGSSDRLELVSRQRSAAALFELRRGTRVVVTR